MYEMGTEIIDYAKMKGLDVCIDCEHFNVTVVPHRHIDNGNPVTYIGECRRHAPVYNVHGASGFPAVNGGDRCGDFEWRPESDVYDVVCAYEACPGRHKPCPVCHRYDTCIQGNPEDGYYVYCDNCCLEGKSVPVINNPYDEWDEGHYKCSPEELEEMRAGADA